MRVLKFTLSGKTAFFKKPEVNSYFYFTYGSIHKVALLGIFGAILGLNGYSQMVKESQYPEFYEQLKDLKIAIVPQNKLGYIPKKIQSFNNSVGYASQEQGGNLIVKEQWLEHPEWDIYVLINSVRAEQLADAIVNRKSVYLPYLGKNDHIADLKDWEIIDQVNDIEEVFFIDSLVPKDWITLDINDEDELMQEEDFKYEEYLPVALDEYTNLYQLQNFVYSNMVVSERSCKVADVKGKKIVFF